MLFTRQEWQLLQRTHKLLCRVEQELGRGPEDGMDAWEFVEQFERESLERLVVKHEPHHTH